MRLAPLYDQTACCHAKQGKGGVNKIMTLENYFLKTVLWYAGSSMIHRRPVNGLKCTMSMPLNATQCNSGHFSRKFRVSPCVSVAYKRHIGRGRWMQLGTTRWTATLSHQSAAYDIMPLVRTMYSLQYFTCLLLLISRFTSRAIEPKLTVQSKLA